MSEEILKQQAETIANLRRENAVLNARLEIEEGQYQKLKEKTDELLGLTQSWKELAAKWEDVSTQKDKIIHQYKQFVIESFERVLREPLLPEVRTKTEEIIRELKK